MNNIETYLRDGGSGMSTGFIWLSMDSNNALVRAMLSFRDTATAAQKVSPEF